MSMATKTTKATPAEVVLTRIMSRTQKEADLDPNACWLYLGAVAEGYGRIKVDGKLRQVTHVMHELFHGPVPEGLQVCHTCDVRNCINPRHLWAGTRSDNMKDCVAKGRLTAMKPEWQDQHAALNATHVETVKEMLNRGLSLRAVALNLNVNHKSVSNLIKRYQIPNPRARSPQC
jgi:hypothetical protein